MIPILNLNFSLSWKAANYSKFWTKTLQNGFKYNLGTKLAPENRIKASFKDARQYFEIRETYDFRNDEDVAGYLREFPIRDQGDCAASWAFSTIGK